MKDPFPAVLTARMISRLPGAVTPAHAFGTAIPAEDGVLSSSAFSAISRYPPVSPSHEVYAAD